MKKKHVIIILLVLAIVLMLTGCSGADKSMLPISGPNGKGVNNDGWFVWILVRPIAFFIDRFSIGGFLGVGIILTTLMVRTIAWPVYAKTNDMSLKMTLAQPEMARIQARYANRQDPVSQQKMQREMMAVWKKYKINPLGCLVAPLIQFPLFMAMYNTVQRYPNGAYTYPEDAKKYAGMTKEVCSWFKHMNTDPAKCDLKTRFCGIDLSKGLTNITDLGKISNWVYVILPLLVGITMVACQLVSQMKPSYAKKAYPGQQESQQQKQTQKMMRFMMIFMTAMMVLMSFRSGTLALYWIVGNLYTIVQSIINRKTNEIKWRKHQETNTITGVKIKVETPKKKKEEKVEKTVEEPKPEKKEKKLKPTMAPKSKREVMLDDTTIEASEETTEVATTVDNVTDETSINDNNNDIVDAEFEEINDEENKDN